MKKSLIALSCFLLMPPGMFYGANCLIINKGTCAVNCSVSATISTVSHSDILNKAADRAASAAALILMKFTWHGHMPYSSVEWGLAFPVRAICLHRERGYAPQIPVEGLPVPGEFHEASA